MDPKATKYKPAWRRGAWLGKDIADHDLISTDGLCIIKTKAVRKISSEWDAELLLGMTYGPMDFFGHRQIKSKQKIIPLPAPLAEEIDEEAEAVRDEVLSDGYSASEPLDVEDAEGRQEFVEAQTWENAGLEHGSEQGGAISPGMMAPVTPLVDMPSDEGVEIRAISHKHASSSPLASEGLKAQKMDDDPVPTPKVKAAKVERNINYIAEVEATMMRRCLMLAWKMDFIFMMRKMITLQNRQKELGHLR